MNTAAVHVELLLAKFGQILVFSNLLTAFTSLGTCAYQSLTYSFVDSIHRGPHHNLGNSHVPIIVDK